MSDVRFQNRRRPLLANAVAVVDLPCQMRRIGETDRSEPLQDFLFRIGPGLEAPINLHHESIAEEDASVVLRRRARNRNVEFRTIVAENAAKGSTMRANELSS